VPIWHEYMAAALWRRPALAFPTPNAYPAWRSLTRGYYGTLGYVAPAPTLQAPTTTVTPPPPQHAPGSGQRGQ